MGAGPQREFVWGDLVARRHATLLAGKPKVGKTTLIRGLACAVATGAPSFLGRPVVGGEVVVVTEESREAALTYFPHERFSLLTREDVWPAPTWTALLEATAARTREVGAVLVVVDTLAHWSRMRADQEKDPSAMQATMAQFTPLLLTGAGVLVGHHQRKGGGQEGDAIRGAGAIAGSADMLVEFERVGEDAPPTQRQLVALGRWTAPGLTLVDFDLATGSWRVLGEGQGRSDAPTASWRAVLLEALASSSDGATIEDLETLVEASKRKWNDALKALVGEGAVSRSGAGVKGDPYRYALPAEMLSRNAVPAPGQNPSGEGGAATIQMLSDPYREDSIESKAATATDSILSPDSNGGAS